MVLVRRGVSYRETVLDPVELDLRRWAAEPGPGVAAVITGSRAASLGLVERLRGVGHQARVAHVFDPDSSIMIDLAGHRFDTVFAFVEGRLACEARKRRRPPAFAVGISPAGIAAMGPGLPAPRDAELLRDVRHTREAAIRSESFVAAASLLWLEHDILHLSER